MALAFDAKAESIRTATTDPYTWTHTPVGTPKAILVAAIHGTSSTDHVVSVSYGGVPMVRVVRAADAAGEPGAAEWWFLGSGIPTGAQTVSADLASATTDDIEFESISYTASGDVDVIDTATLSADQTNPQDTNVTGGLSAVSLAAIYSGLNAVSSLTAVANTTAVDDHAFAGSTFVGKIIRQTNASTSNFTIGWTAASDDVAAAFVTIAESPYLTPIERQSKSNSGSGTSVVVTLDSGTTAGDVVVLEVMDEVHTGVTVTGLGATWEEAGNFQGGNYGVTYWVGRNCSAGQTAITYNMTSSATNRIIKARVFGNVLNTASPIGHAPAGASTNVTTVTPPTVTPTQTRGVAFQVFDRITTGTISAGPTVGWTTTGEVTAATNKKLAGAWRVTEFIGAYGASWTLSGAADTDRIALWLKAAPVPSDVNVNAGNAAGTGAAANGSTKVSPTGGAGSGTGAASAPAASSKPTAGNASGTGTASAPSRSMSIPAGNAVGTGTAYVAAGKSTYTASAQLAFGTGAAANAATTVKAAAGAGSGTGSASAATTDAKADPSAATGTGVASAPASTSTIPAGAATGSGSSFDADAVVDCYSVFQPNVFQNDVFQGCVSSTGELSVNAGLASGSGAAGGVTTSLAGTAGSSSGTGAAGGSGSTLQVPAGAGSGTGAAYTAATTSAYTANAGVATGTGAASDATLALASGPGAGAGAGSAGGSTSTVKPTPGTAPSTGSAFDASGAATYSASPSAATGTGTASGATLSLASAAGTGSGSGSAGGSTSTVKPTPTAATGTGTAYDATVVTEAITNANAGAASGTGSAGAPAVSFALHPSAAAGTGTAFDATPSTESLFMVSADAATGTGAAYAPAGNGAAGEGTGTGTGSAGSGSLAFAVHPSAATGTGTAFDASGQSVVFTDAHPGTATGIGTAFDPSVWLVIAAGPASGTGTAYDGRASFTPPWPRHVHISATSSGRVGIAQVAGRTGLATTSARSGVATVRERELVTTVPSRTLDAEE